MKFLSKIRTALATVAIAVALPASAAFYIDDTTGGPTFNRALEDFSGLSAVGTDVAYDVFSFSVDTDGLYTVRSFAAGLRTDTAWDQFLFLYAGAFDPTMPLMNGIAGDDDFEVIGRSGFDVALSVGTAYYLVTTGFGNTDSGAFLNVIRGPGEILPAIPEPGTYALLAMGLFAVAFAARRRQNDAGFDR
jgi:hypothetical protein